MKTRRLFSFILTVVMALSLVSVMSVSAFAALSTIDWNISSQPCYANRSVAELPEFQLPSQGDTYYINIAATTDYKFDRAEFYVMAPGETSFSCVYDYDPKGYFRWVNCPYQFAQSGLYTVRITLTTTSGDKGSADCSLYVEASTSSEISSSGNTYTYDDSVFNVVSNFKSEYCFNQKDYSRFENSAGKNRGCTATAMCIAYSIYHDSTLSPNDVKWCWAGTSWEYCKRYSDSNKTYKGYCYTQSEGLKAVYNCLMNDDKPIIVGVNGLGSDHVVTVVGVKQGADINSLSLSDFLIVDPWGGNISTLNTYKSLDCGWALRIAIN